MQVPKARGCGGKTVYSACRCWPYQPSHRADGSSERDASSFISTHCRLKASLGSTKEGSSSTLLVTRTISSSSSATRPGQSRQHVVNNHHFRNNHSSWCSLVINKCLRQGTLCPSQSHASRFTSQLPPSGHQRVQRCPACCVEQYASSADCRPTSRGFEACSAGNSRLYCRTSSNYSQLHAPYQ